MTPSRYHRLFQRIFNDVSDEERAELTLGVERIDKCFARLGEQLSCMTTEDRALFFEAFSVSIAHLIHQASRQASGVPFTPENARTDTDASAICAASLISGIEDGCVVWPATIKTF